MHLPGRHEVGQLDPVPRLPLPSATRNGLDRQVPDGYGTAGRCPQPPSRSHSFPNLDIGETRSVPRGCSAPVRDVANRAVQDTPDVNRGFP